MLESELSVNRNPEAPKTMVQGTVINFGFSSKNEDIMNFDCRSLRNQTENELEFSYFH